MSIVEKLMELLGSKEYISGQELASILKTSKPTVHRIILSLKEKGYPIESHPKKGYRLLPDDLSYASKLFEEKIGGITHNVYYIPFCTTTQEVAESLALSGSPEGTIVIAEKMVSGKGRLGRKWFAEKGGLWFTVIYKPFSLVNMQLITLAAGLSIAKSIRELYTLEAKLKWPNDVLINEKKVAGVLVEARIEADASNYVLVGIGVNVNNEVPKVLNTATTLKSLLGKKVYRLPLLKSIVLYLDKYYTRLLEGKTKDIVTEWKKFSSTINREVTVIFNNESIKGKAVDLHSDGSLVILRDEKHRIRVYAGDVLHLR